MPRAAPAPMAVHDLPSSAPPYQPSNRFTRPIPKTRKNFIPPQSWLAYNWTDKDPELDFVCLAIQESGLNIETIEELTERSGHKISRGTIYNWMYGDVRRPQNVTMNTVMAALGYERRWTQR